MTTPTQAPTSTRYAVHITYNHSVNHRSLSAYRIDVSEAVDGDTLRPLASDNVVYNNAETLRGVFATEREAIEAVHGFVDAPFCVVRNDREGDLRVYEVDRAKRLSRGQALVAVSVGDSLRFA